MRILNLNKRKKMKMVSLETQKNCQVFYLKRKLKKILLGIG